MATSANNISKGKKGGSKSASNIARERFNAIYDSVGCECLFAGASTAIPTGWLLCDGSEVLQTAFPQLYALIGTTYGTGSSGFFVLPQFNNRVPIGPLASTGLVTALAGTFAVDATTVSTDHTYLGVNFIIRAY